MQNRVASLALFIVLVAACGERNLGSGEGMDLSSATDLASTATDLASSALVGVPCGVDTCSMDEVCCVPAGTTTFACVFAPGGITMQCQGAYECDGPEDCEVGERCSAIWSESVVEFVASICSSEVAPSHQACHSDLDCPEQHYCSDPRVIPGGAPSLRICFVPD